MYVTVLPNTNGSMALPAGSTGTTAPVCWIRTVPLQLMGGSSTWWAVFTPSAVQVAAPEMAVHRASCTRVVAVVHNKPGAADGQYGDCVVAGFCTLLSGDQRGAAFLP
jgi:hypothetical protein